MFPSWSRAQCLFQFSDLSHADLAPCGGCRAVEGGSPCLTIEVETTPDMVWVLSVAHRLPAKPPWALCPIRGSGLRDSFSRARSVNM